MALRWNSQVILRRKMRQFSNDNLMTKFVDYPTRASLTKWPGVVFLGSVLIVSLKTMDSVNKPMWRMEPHRQPGFYALPIGNGGNNNTGRSEGQAQANPQTTGQIVAYAPNTTGQIVATVPAVPMEPPPTMPQRIVDTAADAIIDAAAPAVAVSSFTTAGYMAGGIIGRDIAEASGGPCLSFFGSLGEVGGQANGAGVGAAAGLLLTSTCSKRSPSTTPPPSPAHRPPSPHPMPAKPNPDVQTEQRSLIQSSAAASSTGLAEALSAEHWRHTVV